MSRRRTLLAGLLLTIVVGGCQARTPVARSEVLLIDATLYDIAFDAAVEASRDAGLPPDLRDRRRGLIETAPREAASLLEPWRNDNTSFAQSVQNTLAYHRRRARFNFVVAESTPDEEPAEYGTPDLLGIRGNHIDLTTATGMLELRISVILERAHTPGMRRNPWSRSLTTQSVVTRGGATAQPALFWAPITRDLEYEQHLLRAVAESIMQASAATGP